MTYVECIQLLESLYKEPHQTTQAVGLSRARRLLVELGDPHTGFRSIQVTGSSGKGSTSTMIASILRSAGFHTGIFRSPHLCTYTERITVDGEDISEGQWVETFERVWPAVERMRVPESDDYQPGRPSLFEVLFAMAALYFAECKVEWAVLEAGMGGRLDATSTVTPDVAVVTNVSLEHTTTLGHSVAKIAVEKAAIIKQGAGAVTAARGEALEVIRERARQMEAPLLEVPRDIRAHISNASLDGQTLSITGNDPGIRVRVPVGGAFQATNAATACAVVVSLRARATEIHESALRQGLETVSIPGRFEVLGRHPTILVDGAQTRAGCEELALSLETLDVPSRRILVFACMRDKDYAHMGRALGRTVQAVVVTRVPATNRAANPNDIAAVFREVCPSVTVCDEADAAFTFGLACASREDMVVVAGSLYLVGFVRRLSSTMGVS